MAAVPHLLDTNTLLRLVKRDVPEHDVVKAAIDHPIGEGADICYTGTWLNSGAYSRDPEKRTALG